MKIYVASSWRNTRQPSVVARLRGEGHEVYDFRHPRPGNYGFNWRQIDPDWENWTPERFRRALEHHVAIGGFALDMDALDWCDACVLVLPCGRSSHLELGYAVGRSKATVALLADGCEPELMYKMVDLLAVTLDEVVSFLASLRGPQVARG